MVDVRGALVLGAGGGIGGETARALSRHGWRVRALSRNLARDAARHRDAGFEWVAGAATSPESVRAAASGVSVIVHAVNPPGYRDWDKRVLPMLDNTIAAARAAGARILLPGTIYNYGADAFPVLREESPQHPPSRKGAIRVEMERRLEAAAAQGTPSLIVRFGDFFGPTSGNNWFSQGMVKPGRPLTVLTYPGRPGAGHAWAYLPDAGETFARLLQRHEALARFERFHFEGFYDHSGGEMIAAVREAAARPKLRVAALPWLPLKLISPFNRTLRELGEMRYLWDSTVRLDGGKLAGFLGHEPRTPPVEALRATLRGLDVLPSEVPRRSPAAAD